MNREQWLTEVANGLLPAFNAKGLFPKNFRITCGWPCRNALSVRRRCLGECHSYKSSKAKISEIFISPTMDEGASVGGVISHELIHAAVGVDQGHKGLFVKACRTLGMVGKPIHASPGPSLQRRIDAIIASIGPYPHAALAGYARPPARSTGQVRMYCPCGCKITISTKWLAEAGPPTCGCGMEMSVDKGE